MQDRAYGLRRIHLPRTPVNNPENAWCPPFRGTSARVYTRRYLMSQSDRGSMHDTNGPGGRNRPVHRPDDESGIIVFGGGGGGRGCAGRGRLF